MLALTQEEEEVVKKKQKKRVTHLLVITAHDEMLLGLLNTVNMIYG